MLLIRVTVQYVAIVFVFFMNIVCYLGDNPLTENISRAAVFNFIVLVSTFTVGRK